MLGELRRGEIYDYVPIAQPPQIPDEIARRWHIVVAEPQREDSAVRRLRDAAFDAYTPVLVKEIRAARGKKREIRAALWPSYLLVALPIGHEDFDGVRSARGVRDFLTLDGSKATLPAAAIDALRAKEAAFEARRQSRIEAERSRAESGAINFEVGQEVLVDVGPFERLFACIETIDARGRVEVMLHAALLGRRLCTVEIAHIRPIDW